MTDAALPFASLAAVAGGEGAAVLVTVAAARGSVPRDAGTMMAVGRDAVAGTIGGGHLEFEAIRVARAALAQGGTIAPWLVRFPLAARLGQCCGGVATLAFERVAAEAPWLAACVAAEHAGVPFARVACLGRDGHLVVTAAGTCGSLGDAALDARAIEAATRQLAAGEDLRPVEVAAPGGARLLVCTQRTFDFTALVFGNGHVGRALVQMLAALPARVRWIDAREDDFPARVPDGVDVIATDIPESELPQAPRGACVVIATHDHSLDFALVTAALARDDWTYLGLIGSRSKRAQFERRLLARGVPATRLERIVCPIGRGETPSLRGKEPGTIALATAAEIAAARDLARSARSGRGLAPRVEQETTPMPAARTR